MHIAFGNDLYDIFFLHFTLKFSRDEIITYKLLPHLFISFFYSKRCTLLLAMSI